MTTEEAEDRLKHGLGDNPSRFYDLEDQALEILTKKARAFDSILESLDDFAVATILEYGFGEA